MKIWSPKSNTTFAQWAVVTNHGKQVSLQKQLNCHGGGGARSENAQVAVCPYRKEAGIYYFLLTGKQVQTISGLLQDSSDYQRTFTPPSMAHLRVFFYQSIISSGPSCSSLQKSSACQLWKQSGKARSLKANCFLPSSPYRNTLNGDLFIKTPLYPNPTSFWPREAVMQVKDDFFHKVLNITMLRSSYKHHPIVSKTLHSGFLPHLGSMPKLQFHLNSTLEKERDVTMSKKERQGIPPIRFQAFLGKKGARGKKHTKKISFCLGCGWEAILHL